MCHLKPQCIIVHCALRITTTTTHEMFTLCKSTYLWHNTFNVHPLLIDLNVHLQTVSNPHKLIDHHSPTPIPQSPMTQILNAPNPQCSNATNQL